LTETTCTTADSVGHREGEREREREREKERPQRKSKTPDSRSRGLNESHIGHLRAKEQKLLP
jgi:hypothetical protein